MNTDQWLTDRIIASQYRHPSLPKLSVMATAPRMRVDQIVDYFYSGTSQEVWSKWDDFPFLIPPFDDMWLETTAPSRVVSDVYGINKWRGPSRMALFVSRADAPADGRNTISPDFARKHPNLPTGTRHLLALSIWLEIEGGIVSDGNLYLVLQLDESGGPVFFGDDTNKYDLCFGISPVVASRLTDAGHTNAQYIDEISKSFDPFLLALSFLNCRNAIIREKSIPRAERRRLEREKRPTAKYYTLTIDAIKRVLDQQMEATGDSLQRALHICRGNFATYSDDHPLFGKYTGKFWRTAHIRGHQNNGIVVKDYRLEHA